MVCFAALGTYGMYRGVMLVTDLNKRLNLRMNQDTYDAYEKVASFFNRTAADLMREAMDASMPTMQALGAMIDRAKAGDKEAVQRLFDSMMAMHQGNLDLARETGAAEMAPDIETATKGHNHA